MDVNKAANSRKATPESDAISRQVAAERAAARITQADMAKRAGISRSAYVALEQGQRVPDVSQLAAICKVLGISLTELISRSMGRVAPVDAAPLREASGK